MKHLIVITLLSGLSSIASADTVIPTTLDALDVEAKSCLDSIDRDQKSRTEECDIYLQHSTRDGKSADFVVLDKMMIYTDCLSMKRR
jgi:hypothetical protein